MQIINKGKLKNIKKKPSENQGYVLYHTYLNQECITNPVLFPYFLKNISIYKIVFLLWIDCDVDHIQWKQKEMITDILNRIEDC